jgi:pyruvate dehydrogenase E1 component alpha subunit
VECKTWRHHGHFEGDPSIYKKPAEQSAWLAKDPIPRLEKKLVELKYADDSAISAMRKKVEDELAAAVAFAEKSPYPQPQEVLTDVLA